MMFRRPLCSRWLAAGAGVAASLSSAFLLTGCGAKPAEPPVAVATETPGSSAETPAGTARKIDFNIPFGQAVTEELGDDQLLPPDRTIAGKSTAPLREAVEKLWPKIQLVDKSGQPVPYVVTIETAEGSVDITLSPETAPNHVRNFLALVKLGYYDGLKFDRVIKQEALLPEGKKMRLEMLKAGCPAGTGDPGIGHIGYHLRPEFHDTIKHEAGTVGFGRDANPGSAGVRFYVTLDAAPAIDGNFSLIGKVTRGLDALRKIADGKLLAPEIDPAREFPEKPVAMTKVTVKPDPTAGAGDMARPESLK